ncbi:hypothetical protein AAFF_G00349880 [Aldrovandia affinis]|uniref:Uncharacterized protein n=1 Tax=Aldrovandia affinis TaxID=143900 RepID=A0AAD7WNQ1_9TELE|nr:hypothetical protein AAFF_G00349880 [Aldrovandia affinis]
MRTDFPHLLGDAACRAGLTMPPLPTHSKFTGVNKAERVLPRAHTTPQFPDFMDFVKSTWAVPAKVVLPATHFSPFTNLEGWSEEYATGTLRAEDGVQAYLAPDSVAWTTRHPLPPKREAEVKLLDKILAGAAQATTPANLAFVRVSLSELTISHTSLGEAEVTEVCHLAGIALHLIEAIGVCTGHTIALATVATRHARLSTTAITKSQKANVLNTPLSTTGLFGSARRQQCFKRREETRQHLQQDMPLPRLAVPSTGRVPTLTVRRRA